MMDGDDWDAGVDLDGVNIHIVRDVPRERKPRLRYTAIWQSKFANRLLESGVDTVIRTDIDEFLCIDPRAEVGLREYLQGLAPGAMKAAMGLDVIQAPHETPLQPGLPLLEQRRNAILTREYCKLVVVRQNLRWVGGFHRGRHVEIDMDPNLVLFHLALFDRSLADGRIAGRKAVAEHETQGTHIAKRLDRFSEVANGLPLAFDDVASQAHKQIMQSVPSKTGPHPGFILNGNVARGFHVQIPERMRNILPAPSDFWGD